MWLRMSTMVLADKERQGYDPVTKGSKPCRNTSKCRKDDQTPTFKII